MSTPAYRHFPGRADYCKLLLHMDYDQFETWYKPIRTFWADRIAQGYVCRTPRVKPLGTVAGDNKRRYVVESWGLDASALLNRTIEAHSSNITRIDIRIGLEYLTYVDIVQLIDSFRSESSRLSKYIYESPIRQRTDGRHGGGMGIAIGSHKSDVRVSVYKRANEYAAYEVQASGDVLKRILSEYRQSLRDLSPIDALGDVYNSILALGSERIFQFPQTLYRLSQLLLVDFYQLQWDNQAWDAKAPFTGTGEVVETAEGWKLR